MKIRQVNSANIKRISEIVSQCYRRYAVTDGYPGSLINELIVLRGSSDSIQNLIEQESVFVSENNENIVGMVSVYENEITKLFIEPDSQRRGIGTLLFRHAESIIQSSGFSELFLGVATPSAMGFYEKMGLNVSETKSISHGPCKGRQIKIMKKTLS